MELENTIASLRNLLPAVYGSSTIWHFGMRVFALLTKPNFKQRKSYPITYLIQNTPTASTPIENDTPPLRSRQS